MSSHYVMAFSLAVHGAALVFLFKPGGQFLRVCRNFLLALTAVFLMRLPWLGDFSSRLDKTEGGAAGLDLWRGFLDSIPPLTSTNVFFQSAFIILTIAGLLVALYFFPRQGILLSVWLAASIPLTQAGLWYVGQLYNQRHIVWALPAAALAVAGGIIGLAVVARQFFGQNRLTRAKYAGAIVIGIMLGPLLIHNVWQAQQNPLVKQSWPLGLLQEATAAIAAQADTGDTIIGVPNARHLQFYLHQSRPDLAYLDAGSDNLPAKLQGRWYIFYGLWHIPERWQSELSYQIFYDILVVHRPGACDIRDCMAEAQILFSEAVEANPDDPLREKIDLMLSGLTGLAK
jgi:hypothetical protein